MLKVPLYHITPDQNIDAIARNGLKREKKDPARKRWEEDMRQTMGDDWEADAPYVEPPPDVTAQQELDQLLRDAQRAVDGAEKFPDHGDSTFFWGKEVHARTALDETDAPTALVVVDMARFPEGCKCAVGDHHAVANIYSTLRDMYDEYTSAFGTTEEELYEDAKQWWEHVRWYEGNVGYLEEIWCGCGIPPGAIAYIEDSTTGDVVYRNDWYAGGSE